MIPESKALKEALRIQGASAFNIKGYSNKRKLNQHCVRYEFDDSTWLKVFAYRAEYSGTPGKPCYHVKHNANRIS